MGVLSGRAGLVTGAGRGIGRSIALELGRNGADVAVGYSTSSAAAEEVAGELGGLGVKAFPLKVDVSQPDEVKSAMASVVERFEKIDFLVNNAGITRDRTLAKLGPEDWDAVINVNLSSVYHATSAALPHMLERGFGRIVNISSFVGQAGNFGQTNYAAAKAGMIGFTKAAALEVAKRGITVNCIAPGFIETEMVAAMPEEARQRVLPRIPMGRFGKPEEVAQVVVFLIGQGDYITGQVIGINGGIYM